MFLTQLRTSGSQDETQQQARPLPGETVPTTTKHHEVYDLKEIDTVQKGTAPQSPGKNQKFTIGLSNLGLGIQMTFYEATKYYSRRNT